MSAIPDIVAALDRHLKLLQSADVAWENVKYEPIVNQPWLKVKFLPARSMVVGIGQNAVKQHTGTYQVSVMVPPNSSIANAIVRAEAIMGHFQYGMTLQENATTVMLLQSYIGPALNDGSWVSLPVSCPWNCYEKP